MEQMKNRTEARQREQQDNKEAVLTKRKFSTHLEDWGTTYNSKKEQVVIRPIGNAKQIFN